MLKNAIYEVVSWTLVIGLGGSIFLALHYLSLL